ncbi:MAG: aminoglycoside phosphotransferase family protein [Bacteroidetes bacterium]|nr:aminoglycoside phosphotransferase family protein [Bacteroidota bacterium]
MDNKRVIEIASLFLPNKNIKSAKSYGGGHINDTFLIGIAESDKRFILQKINKNVFKTPEHVVHNIELYLNHLHQKNEFQLKTFKTSDEKPYVIDENRDFWRMYNYIENSISYFVIEKEEHAFQAAKAFGKMQRLCLDLNTNDFFDPIPDFHDLNKRYLKFDKVLELSKKERRQNADKEILFVQDQRRISDLITDLTISGELPKRITHNDTKLNNVLLDAKTGEGICVIDLDTLMPGLVLYDFGDMVRTFTSPVPEDETDSSKVILRKEVFSALSRGYLSELSNVLTITEKNQLINGAKYMILIIGLRFLTDYLENDVYFKTAYDEHNLVRARNQFALLADLLKNEEELINIIESYF